MNVGGALVDQYGSQHSRLCSPDRDMPLKIAFIVSYFPKLSEIFILNQALELEKRGHRVEFFALTAGGEKAIQPGASFFLQNARVYYAQMPKNSLARLLRSLSLLRSVGYGSALRAFDVWRDGEEALSLRNLYRLKAAPDPADGFDIVHAQFGEVGRQCCFLHRLGRLRAPLVCSFRGNDLSGYLNHARTGVYRNVFQTAQACLPVSSRWIKTLTEMGCPAEKIHVLPSGIPIKDLPERKSYHLQGNGPLLVSVARLIAHKGIHYGLDVFAAVAERFPQARYVIIGDGPESASLQSRARGLGLSDRVAFLGSITHEQVLTTLSGAHLLLFTSVTSPTGRTEGVPNILKEAHAYGVPVVAFVHPGTDEVVADAATGMIVPERDVKAMSAAALAILGDEDRAASMSQAARQKAREFDIESITDRLITIYRSLSACAV